MAAYHLGFLVTLSATALTACAPVDLQGSWSGTWRTTLAYDNGTITMELEQDGDAVSGSFDLDGSLCVGSGSLDGQIDNRTFTATMINGVGGEIVIDTRVSADSDSFDGTFDVTDGFCENTSGKLDLSLD